MPSSLLLLALASPIHAPVPTVNVPADYRANRIIAEPRTADGKTLHLWVDTGGGGSSGMYLLTDTAVERLHLATSKLMLGKQPLPVAALPDFEPGAGVPAPVGKYSKAMVVPAKGLAGPGDTMRYDGMLGAGYLPGEADAPQRVWTFDYPGKRLVLQGSDWHPTTGAHQTPLHFPEDSKHRRQTGFARIVVHVDNHPLSLLLDTGATGYPTPAATAVQGGKDPARATSFITTGQLERWHQAHPQWRVVQDADRMPIKGKPMRAIEVPSIDIAGWQTGPVWFTERPDTNFHDFMSSMMDAQVEGALGGNAFQHFVMTVDYGHAKASFQCVQGCRASNVATKATMTH